MSNVHEGREVRHNRGLLGVALLGFGAVLAFEAITGVNVSVLSVLGAAWFGHMAISKKIWWAWIPFAFLAMDAMADIGRGLFGFLPGERGILLPLLVISGGVLLFTRPKRPHPLAIVVLVLCLIGLASSGRNGHGDRIVGGAGKRITSAIPVLDGKTLEVRTTSGDVKLVLVPGLKAPVVLERSARVSVDATKVVVTADDSSDDLTIRLPRAVDLQIRTSSGEIEGRVEGGDIALRSTSGDVNLELGDTDAKVDIWTSSGEVDLAFAGSPDIELTTSSGELHLDGYSDGDEDAKQFVAEGAQGDIKVRTTSGDIDVEREERPLR